MRKNLFILAAALAVCYSCSNDETVEVNLGEAISFRPLVNNVTRAATDPQIMTAFAAENVINVWADYDQENDGSPEKYFYDAYTYSTTPSASFSSTNPHYWPATVSADNEMTFYATYGGVTQTAGGVFAGFTPATAAASQIDLLVAKHISTSKEASVVLNFRHALSQIAVKVKNSNANLKVTVKGVRIGYVKTAATAFSLAFDASDTDSEPRQEAASGSLTSGANLVAASSWTLTDATDANTNKYDQTLTNNAVLEGATEAIDLLSTTPTDYGFKPWLLLPQTMKAFVTDGNSEAGSGKEYATKQTGTATGTAAPDLSGSYIALQMTIENWNGTAVTGTMVQDYWCYWPIDNLGAWTPGLKYTYLIDVAGGGYQALDINNDKKLDPILQEIVISPECTIDVWNAQTDIQVNN